MTTEKVLLSIPVGSQHISLLEPLHFRFETDNEKVVNVSADVGYVHRGIEKACATKFQYSQVPYVVARVCGLCAISHSTAAAQTIEKLLNLEISKKAKYLRILVSELDRLHSHMLCLAHTAENSGFEALFMNIMRDRETIMESLELVTGNRVQFDYACIGGVNRDLTPETGRELKKRLNDFKKSVDYLRDVFSHNWSLGLKYKGIGALTKEEAMRFNVVGPLARAAGLAVDVRNETEDLLPWKEVGFQMILAEDGDIYSRNLCRIREMYNSIDMLHHVIEGLPENEALMVKPQGQPEGDAIVRLEAPRGELFYFMRGNKKPVLERVKIKAPTFSNIPGFIEIFKGSQYSDIPPIIASLDPCLSCTAR